MGDIMSALQTAGSGIMQGIEGIPGDIQGLGQGLSSLFSGGGGPISPGSVGADASTMVNAAPNALGSAVDTAANVAAPAAPALASQFSFPIGAGGAALGDPTAGISDFSTPGMTATPAIDPTSILAQATNIPAVSDVPGTMVDTLNTASSPYALPGGTLATGATPRGSSWLQSLLTNPKAIGALGGLGANLLAGGFKTPPEIKQMQALEAQQAGMAKNQGEIALGEQSGLLPAGLTNMLQQQLSANLAAIRANHANDPGSSAQLQDEMKARADIAGQIALLGQNLAKGSWSNYQNATKYESDLLKQIYDAETAHGTALGNVLSKFATAAADAFPPPQG